MFGKEDWAQLNVCRAWEGSITDGAPFEFHLVFFRLLCHTSKVQRRKQASTASEALEAFQHLAKKLAQSGGSEEGKSLLTTVPDFVKKVPLRQM